MHATNCAEHIENIIVAIKEAAFMLGVSIIFALWPFKQTHLRRGSDEWQCNCENQLGFYGISIEFIFLLQLVTLHNTNVAMSDRVHK